MAIYFQLMSTSLFLFSEINKLECFIPRKTDHPSQIFVGEDRLSNNKSSRLFIRSNNEERKKLVTTSHIFFYFVQK